MGHIHSDRIEEAARDIPRLMSYLENKNVNAFIEGLRRTLSELGNTPIEVGNEGDTRRENRLNSEIHEYLNTVYKKTQSGEMSEDEAIGQLEKTLETFAEYLQCLEESAHQWFQSNLPDYTYSINIDEYVNQV